MIVPYARHVRLRTLSAVVGLALVFGACGSDDDTASEEQDSDASSAAAAPSATDGSASTGAPADGDNTINIVGFAVPEAANKAIAEAWAETPAGADVEFKTSYGASGDQSRAVVAGLEADYVHFSVAAT